MLTPVTNMHIVIDSGSTRIPTGTLQAAELNHVKYCCTTTRWSAGSWIRPARTMQATTKAPPTAAVPTTRPAGRRGAGPR